MNSRVRGLKGDGNALIHHDIRRLDQLNAQHDGERFTLLQRLSAIRSPIATLPNETLSSIFEHACPPPDFSDHRTLPYYSDNDIEKLPKPQYFQFTLSAVSFQWRQVVQSTPGLWACVVLKIKTKTAEKRAIFLRLFIENSKRVPFTLALQFSHDVDPGSSYLVHQTIDNLLIEALPRMKSLHLVNPPRLWQNYTPDLSLLHNCSFNLSFLSNGRLIHDGQLILPFNAPLHRFSLLASRDADVNVQLPWRSITSLTLSDTTSDLSIPIFIQCPNLIEFRCYPSPSWHHDPPRQVTLSDPVSFQYLEVFHWEFELSPWNHALIRYLHLPALKKMRLGSYVNLKPSDHEIRAFFNRLPPTLTTVELRFSMFNFNFICNHSNIENLALHRCSPSDTRIIYDKLTPSLQAGQMVRPLPRLKRLLIECELFDQESLADPEFPMFFEPTPLVEMLEQRLDDSNRSFIVETTEDIFEWTPSAQVRLTELMDKGFDVKIIENVKRNSEFWDT